MGRIIETYRDLGRASQVTLLVGPSLASLQQLTETFLPKAAIDKASFRMGELLKQRIGTTILTLMQIKETAVRRASHDNFSTRFC